MFDWLFSPSCPCDVAAKEWIEERLAWLAEEFDDGAFNGRRIVRPTPEFFPDPYDGSKKAVRQLLDRVCEYMDVVPDLVELKFVSDSGKIWNVEGFAQPSAAGTYEEGEHGFIIRINREGLNDTVGLVGTMAHELAHVRLLGESRILRETFDNEILTDLTIIHFGLGVFLANTPRNWDDQLGYGKWPGTRLKKPEYMTPPMFGWALAHLAWFRGETRPDWAIDLTGAARANLDQGIRYLAATGDSTYRPARHR